MLNFGLKTKIMQLFSNLCGLKENILERMFAKIQVNVQKNDIDKINWNVQYYDVPLEYNKHWMFIAGWQPILSNDILFWLKENKIEKYILRKDHKNGNISMKISFENSNDAVQFKMIWR